METNEIKTKLKKLNRLETVISCSLKAYTELLSDWEKEQKNYVLNDAPVFVIKTQEQGVIRLKAKIEVLTQLNK